MNAADKLGHRKTMNVPAGLRSMPSPPPKVKPQSVVWTNITNIFPDSLSTPRVAPTMTPATPPDPVATPGDPVDPRKDPTARLDMSSTPLNPQPSDVDPAALQIVFYPHEVLRQTAQPLIAVDDHVRAVAARMIQLMHEARGVGLAAPQVGLPWRLFVANPANEPGDDTVYINPDLTDPGPHTEPRDEGCLSLPGITAEVTRPTTITINALDADGQPFSLTSDDFPARVWQHELDHLDGILILDKMTRIDRMANKRAIQELESNI